MNGMIKWAEAGWIPDALVRMGTRRQLRAARRAQCCENRSNQKRDFLAEIAQGPVALSTEEANRQHYELPPAFFESFLGKHRKYSCCHWPVGVETLDQAEESMLALTTERADLADGQDVLELGCGWGSLALWMAEKYPRSRILAVSNSRPQRLYIEEAARNRGFTNLEIVTCDLNTFRTDRSFDRIVSIECFEHLRNVPEMFGRMRTWLRPAGRAFLHVFCHREEAYTFEEDDWMGQFFFRSGMMPSEDLYFRINNDLRVIDQWRVNGQHYARTLDAWLDRYDRHQGVIQPILKQIYPASEVARWNQRWRMFFLICSEVFGYSTGNEWFVSHYLLEPR